MEERRREMFAGDTHVCRALALHNAVSSFQNHLIAEDSIGYTHCILENKQLPLYTVWLIHDLTSLQSREKDHHTDSYFLWLCRTVPALPGVLITVTEGPSWEYKIEWTWLTPRERNNPQRSLLSSWLTLDRSSPSYQGSHLELTRGHRLSATIWPQSPAYSGVGPCLGAQESYIKEFSLLMGRRKP